MADTKVKLIALLPLHEDRYVSKNEEFKATEHRAAVLVKAGIARLVGENKNDDKASADREVPLEWKKKMSPSEYVEKHPNGPSADLAKAIIAKEAEKSATDETPAPE